MAITALRRFICGKGRQGKPIDGFARDDKGSAGVEFALTMPIFVATFLSIFEFAMVFGTSVMLEAATNNAARAVRIGQVFAVTTDPLVDEDTTLPEIDPDTGEVVCDNQQECAFESALCDGLVFINCADLSYNVEVFTTFASANANVVCDTNGHIAGAIQPTTRRPSQANFIIGGPAQIVVVTVLYRYQPILPNPLSAAGQDWDSAGGCNGLAMKSVLVFVNEPFPTT